jgi:hypothetical protein
MRSIANSAVSARQESYLRLDFSRATVELTTLYGYTNANWRYSLPPDATDAERDASKLWQTLPDEHAVQRGSITQDDPFYYGMAHVFAREAV